MHETLYPTMGTKVSYIRENKLGAPESGTGIVLGIAVDATKRVTAHLEINGGEKINVDLLAINPSDEYITKFAEAIKEVKAIGEMGNGEIKVIVDKFNGMVDSVYDTVFGGKVTLEVNETVAIKEESEDIDAVA